MVNDALVEVLLGFGCSLPHAKVEWLIDTSTGFVTFAHFTCQRRCALKDRTKENQSLGALDVGTKSTENGLFLASVTMPSV